MNTSFAALCTDFYVNQKLALKMDLPSNRETVLDMFDRIKRDMPEMDRFRRYENELALESPEEHAEYSWMAIKQTSVRSGWVNPDLLDRAYRLHQLILETAPYFLSITPLDVDYLELVFGFDLEAQANRNEIVFDALLADSPLALLIDFEREHVLDAQPFIGFSLNEKSDLQAFVEIKTRTRPTELAHGHFEREPISIYLTIRQHGPLKSMSDFATTFARLAGHAERLSEDRVIPHIVAPIREAIISRPSG